MCRYHDRSQGCLFQAKTTVKKAGHRRWGAYGQRVPGRHRGDIMSVESRSRLMAQIKCRNTGPERIIQSFLSVLPYSFECHPNDLPGRPDFVFRRRRVAIFVDGDFWHGYRFPLWRHKLQAKWRTKIERNRNRDRRNFCRLRRSGWTVLRIWEHQIEQRLNMCFDRIRTALAKQIHSRKVCK